MKLDFNEFHRVVTCILVILLVIQGLDYIFGFGVNNYIFVIFCIVFAFTIGAIYHNVLEDKEDKKETLIKERINNIQSMIDKEFKENGLTESVIIAQEELDNLKNDLGLYNDNEEEVDVE